MVLCQDLPHCLQLWVDPHEIRHARSLKSSLHTRPQNLEAFSNMRKWAKKDKMWSVLPPKIRFLLFLLSRILLSYLNNRWYRSCWQRQSICRNMWTQFVYMSVPLYWTSSTRISEAAVCGPTRIAWSQTLLVKMEIAHVFPIILFAGQEVNNNESVLEISFQQQKLTRRHNC